MKQCSQCGVRGGCGCLFTHVNGQLICGLCSGRATMEKAAEIRHLRKMQGIEDNEQSAMSKKESANSEETNRVVTPATQQLRDEVKETGPPIYPDSRNIQLFHADNTPADMHDILAKRSVFLVCGGPSLNQLDLSLLNQRGIVTMAINNAAAIVKPNFWIGGDIPGHFIEQIWLDPTVVKFVPQYHRDKHIRLREKNGGLLRSEKPTHRMPNTWFFHRREWFDPSNFLADPGFPWGGKSTFTDTSNTAWCKTSMLLAVKMLWYLGAGTIYLVGCNFKMETGKQNYAFPQEKSADVIWKDNEVYKALNYRFSLLKPQFDELSFQIINCTPESGLKVFPYMEFSEAVAKAAAECNEKPIITEGMYEEKK